MRLRALSEGDLNELHGVYTHPLVVPWIGHHTLEDVAEELQFYVKLQRQHSRSFWAVE